MFVLEMKIKLTIATFIVAMFAAVSTPVLAEDDALMAIGRQKCDIQGEFAETVAKARDRKVSRHSMLESATHLAETVEDRDDFWHIVMDVYASKRSPAVTKVYVTQQCNQYIDDAARQVNDMLNKNLQSQSH